MKNLDRAVDLIASCFERGGKLLICGNGGSGADSAHILGEFVKGFMSKRPLPAELIEKIGQPWAEKLQMGLPAIDLTANNALIGAVANDQDGQLALRAAGHGLRSVPATCLLGISTSGNAENVARAMIVARALGAKCVALTGRDGGQLRGLADILLNVDETETYKVQEKHLPLYHQLCMRVEARPLRLREGRMEKLYWGLDIGGTKCALVTGTHDCRVLSRHAVATRDFCLLAGSAGGAARARRRRKRPRRSASVAAARSTAAAAAYSRRPTCRAGTTCPSSIG